MTSALDTPGSGSRTVCRTNDSQRPRMPETSIRPSRASRSMSALRPSVPMITTRAPGCAASWPRAGVTVVTRAMSACRSPAARIDAGPVRVVHPDGRGAAVLHEHEAAGCGRRRDVRRTPQRVRGPVAGEPHRRGQREPPQHGGGHGRYLTRDWRWLTSASRSPLPAQSGDTRIRGKGVAIELEARVREIADGADAVRVQADPPGLPLERLTRRERAATEQRDVRSRRRRARTDSAARRRRPRAPCRRTLGTARTRSGASIAPGRA